MGSLIGGAIGLAGSLLGGSSKKQATNNAQQLDLTGYNYLKNNTAVNAAQGAVPGAVAGQTAALNGQKSVADTTNDLLTGGQNSTAFKNYLGSTGYNFQMQQGTGAINANASSRGLRDSGSTAKALTTFGQGLGSQYFNNYLGQLNTNATQYGANATGFANQENSGVDAAKAVGGAGSSGGVQAGQAATAGGQAMGNSIASAAGIAGSAVANNWGDVTNFLGRVF